MKFGRRLLLVRKEKGHTIDTLAEAAGVSRTTISALETHRHLPAARNLAALSEALGYTMDELWYGNGRLENKYLR